MILNGTKIAEKIYSALENDISKLESKPTLGAVLVGEKDSPSLRYIRQKKRECEKIGMGFELFTFPSDISQKQLEKEILSLNTRQDISGYIVQLPLPAHINPLEIIKLIDPNKDVDGFHPENQGKIMIGDESGFAPCTPAGVMKIFQEYDISLSGKKVCIIGRSNIVGKPLTIMCINQGASVSSCNSQTPNLEEFTQNADIIISATGIPHLLTPNMTSKNAIIIDVGFCVVEGKILGDADTNAFLDNGNTITPVPGGVGPMTVAMLLTNTLHAHHINNEK